MRSCQTRREAGASSLSRPGGRRSCFCPSRCLELGRGPAWPLWCLHLGRVAPSLPLLGGPGPQGPPTQPAGAPMQAPQRLGPLSPDPASSSVPAGPPATQTPVNERLQGPPPTRGRDSPDTSGGRQPHAGARPAWAPEHHASASCLPLPLVFSPESHMRFHCGKRGNQQKASSLSSRQITSRLSLLEFPSISRVFPLS